MERVDDLPPLMTQIRLDRYVLSQRANTRGAACLCRASRAWAWSIRPLIVAMEDLLLFYLHDAPGVCQVDALIDPG
ncbi:MAG TPA: hypothetical protein VGF67_08845 [Ktedonobacteraceae bacterium]|jgi:hypothetical protein